MKRLLTFFFTAGLFFASGLIFTNCTKEGPQGPGGTAGTNGKDANATCTQCHNVSDTIVVKIFQYNASKHSKGSSLPVSTCIACAPCHCSQGFKECLVSNRDSTVFGFADAAPVNCRTCHNIHTSYTNVDWALKTSTFFTLRIDHDITMNLQGGKGFGKGSANLCGRCHQACKPDPWVTNPTGTDYLTVRSGLWGPHFGTQSLVLGAKGAFEFGTPFASGSHKDSASCTSCHGALCPDNLVPGNAPSGGHTLNIGIALASGANPAKIIGCDVAGCHLNPMTEATMEEMMAEVKAKWTILLEKLIAKNIIDAADTLVKASNSNPLIATQKQMACVWNFKLVQYDKSWGMHNFTYTMNMLDASIAAIDE